MSDREPPLGKDLAGAQVPYTWKPGERVGARAAEGEHPSSGSSGDDESEAARLRAEVRYLRSALEDIVAFALSSADHKERAVMMHRRAVAALTRPPRPDPHRSPA
jgi:hypothetical protein